MAMKQATFQHPIFQDETAAREALGGGAVAEAYLPSLWQQRSRQDRKDGRQVASSRPVLLQRMQRPVHRDGRHRV